MHSVAAADTIAATATTTIAAIVLVVIVECMLYRMTDVFHALGVRNRLTIFLKLKLCSGPS